MQGSPKKISQNENYEIEFTQENLFKLSWTNPNLI